MRTLAVALLASGLVACNPVGLGQLTTDGGGSCLESSDCADGLSCVDGACVGLCGQESLCNAHYAEVCAPSCPSCGLFPLCCVDNGFGQCQCTCQPSCVGQPCAPAGVDAGPVAPACGSDTDCACGETCSAGTCVIGTHGLVSCTQNSDCASADARCTEDFCFDGACLPIGWHCSNDRECGTVGACDLQASGSGCICRDSGGACQTDADCAACGEVCGSDGHCGQHATLSTGGAGSTGGNSNGTGSGTTTATTGATAGNTTGTNAGTTSAAATGFTGGTSAANGSGSFGGASGSTNASTTTTTTGGSVASSTTTTGGSVATSTTGGSGSGSVAASTSGSAASSGGSGGCTCTTDPDCNDAFHQGFVCANGFCTAGPDGGGTSGTSGSCALPSSDSGSSGASSGSGSLASSTGSGSTT